jgi:HAD superfamily hydrolase (TIGR01549 family)
MHKKPRTVEEMIQFPKINLDNVKGVLLDLDNTLYYYDDCHTQAIEECYFHYKNHLDGNMTFVEFCSIYRQKRDLVTKRLTPQGVCRSRLFAFQAMFEEFHFDSNWELAATYDAIYWDSFIDVMVIAKDALKFLEECKKLKIDICIVSDMTANIQIRKLQKLGCGSYVKYLVTSEEVGAEKPDPKMFQTAISKLGIKPEEAIMIGDSETKDIKGSEVWGIKSYKISIENI